MPPLVINVSRADDARDVVHRAVQALAEGELVALPTETVYGIAASATHPDAVARLAAAKGRDAASPFALAIKSAEDAEDYAPGWNPTARRLARRCWPGPVTLVVDANRDEGLISRLPAAVLPYICPNGTVGLRSPANQLVQDILRMLAGPIALTSANQTGEPDATTAQQCVDALGDKLSLVLDDGPARYGQPSSVVRITPTGFDVLREGVVGRPTLERLSRMLVVFVCTGNTCRSPLAEVVMRRRLAEGLGVAEDELESSGVMIASAGIAAAVGSPASPETAEVLRQQGMSADGHAAQQLTEHLVRQADLLIAMTPSHVESILSLWPEAAGRVKLVDASGGAISDPIGGPLEVYQRCAEQIERGVEHHAAAILAELRAG
ncbi:Threonylcarbamoyl-AMP synthase [Botrimarina colliarenosi]|uniref:L-threonylcarbamoyladenylate synthase n=1 Tax=Botrimarina colliarenosi TaxID=2528001 RepID=A0A5C6AIX1_9BACT|nr:L-threonylcarbamoyladenylate synthase [Botrimarina colliarenosi]TWT99417.1 Threonylcarbamoyl-AMP synthase [Botrimarina colliarenosi]